MELIAVERDHKEFAKRWQKIEEIFEAVVGLPPVQRDPLLDRICPASDPTIRSHVMELLEADQKAEDFLEEPPLSDQKEQVLRAFARPHQHQSRWPTLAQCDAAAFSPEQKVQDLKPGDIIGDRYRIEAMLGEGGMGTVYEAMQIAPIRRVVAIKVIKLGMDTRQVISRFEVERQTLAVMTHPNIARILDAGATSRGRPYFVLELVSGSPITTYCSQRGLDVDARLKLFGHVCDAVQHAHQKSVIHRDLKPSNVLVTEQDGQPVVKVIDFGIAKATSGGATEHTLGSEASLFIGTPAYMSPEQIDGGAEVDTRTDVYALGLVLYELLTGSPAYEATKLRQAGLYEMQRVIKEVEPERPSTRVGRNAPGGYADSATLRRRLRGDLDWIVMKALAKEPRQRYDTASALALDIKRHFDNQPVHAGPPSTSYVLGKLARRNKRLLAAVSAFALLVLVAVVAMYLKSQEALAARDQAAGLLRISNVERGRLLGQTGAVGPAEVLLWREFLRAPDSLHAYWALWESFMRSRCVATAAGHDGRADEIDLDLSGRVLVSAGDDGHVVVRDAASLRVDAVLTGPDSEMRALALSDDGRLVAAGGATGVIVVWELTTRTPLKRWQASDRPLLAMDFAPDGRRLVSGGSDGVVRLWYGDTGKLVAELDRGAGLVQCLRFSPDGALVAAGHVDQITLWDGAPARFLRGAPPLQKVFPAVGATTSLAFSRDGRFLAAGGTGQCIDVWELGSGSRVDSFEGTNSTVRSLVFGPDGQTLFSACWYSVDRWDLASGERLWNVPTSTSLWGLVLDPQGRLLTATIDSGELRRWEVDRGTGAYRISEQMRCRSAVFSCNGHSVLSGNEQGRIQIAELTTGDIQTTIAGHEAAIRSLDVSGDQTCVASASADGAIRVRDIGSGALICAVDDGIIQTSRAIDLDDAGRHLAYAATGGRFKVRTIASGREIEIITPLPAESLSIVFSPDGVSLVTVARDHFVRFWTVKGEPLGAVNLVEGGGLWSMAYSPDGALLALGLWDRSIRILNIADRSFVAVLEGHGGTVWGVTFKPDDPRILASAAADGTVRLWDILNQLNLATISVAPGRDVHTVSFTPDGATLLAAGEFDGPVWYDLIHFERHIAGNLEYQIERFRAELSDQLSGERADELRSWAAGVIKRPWPRLGARN
ncbi:MAG: protein kinase [bacterium]|nr:protein kinase [bacterium]